MLEKEDPILNYAPPMFFLLVALATGAWFLCLYTSPLPPITTKELYKEIQGRPGTLVAQDLSDFLSGKNPIVLEILSTKYKLDGKTTIRFTFPRQEEWLDVVACSNYCRQYYLIHLNIKPVY
jgi:hypothetical protein